MDDTETTQARRMRWSVPPYYLGMEVAGIPVVSLPGEMYEGIERCLAPSGEEARQTLLRLRERLRWSRPMLAAFLGVSRHVVRRWETGERKPNGAARRLIWLSYLLATEPQKLRSGLDAIFWERSGEMEKLGRSLRG